MTVKNLEYNVVDRIVTQLALPDGTGNYNNSIVAAQVHTEFKTPTQINVFPALVIGDVSIPETIPLSRSAFEIPIEVEIWGYTKKEVSTRMEVLKLLSDVRVAILSDEWLNQQVNGLTLSAEMGEMEGFGVLRLTLSGTMEHT